MYLHSYIHVHINTHTYLDRVWLLPKLVFLCNGNDVQKIMIMKYASSICIRISISISIYIYIE